MSQRLNRASVPTSVGTGETLARARVLRKWNSGTLVSKYLTSLTRSQILTVGTLAHRLIGTLAPASHSPTVPRVPPRARATPGRKGFLVPFVAVGRSTPTHR